MRFVRWFLARIILSVDFLFRPKFKKHSPVVARKIKDSTSKLSLYEFRACPFCVKVRWAMRRLGLDIQIKDAKNINNFKQELLEGGGRVKVPCLKIEDKDSIRWMYESSDIISYLKALEKRCTN